MENKENIAEEVVTEEAKAEAAEAPKEAKIPLS